MYKAEGVAVVGRLRSCTIQLMQVPVLSNRGRYLVKRNVLLIWGVCVPNCGYELSFEKKRLVIK